MSCRLSSLLSAFVLLSPLLQAAESKHLLEDWRERMQPLAPRSYDAPRCTEPPVIDGRLDEKAWADAAWTADFLDIEGSDKPAPRFRTRAKILWDATCLYIAAELEEPHVLGSLTAHDSVIFQDPDFEVFIDPNGDNHRYYEFEINALNTSWDLQLSKPYLDLGKPDNRWNIPGLRSAVGIQGTLNRPDDTDTGWTVELAIPWAAFSDSFSTPQAGAVLRLNFSRVEWHYDIRDGRYEKRPGLKEDNWVWSPQGVVDMHRPEMWGLLRLAPPVSTVELRQPPMLPARTARDLVLDVYAAQHDFNSLTGRWAGSLAEIGWTKPAYGASFPEPRLTLTEEGYLCELDQGTDGLRHRWRIRQDRLLQYQRLP